MSTVDHRSSEPAALQHTLTARIARYLRDGAVDDLIALYSPDALLDANVPQWRFRLQGPSAIAEVLHEATGVADRQVIGWRATTTSDGLVAEMEVHFQNEGSGEQRLWREVHILRTDGEAITEHVSYCTGIWDEATIARHAAEAPMVRR